LKSDLSTSFCVGCYHPDDSIRFECMTILLTLNHWIKIQDIDPANPEYRHTDHNNHDDVQRKKRILFPLVSKSEIKLMMKKVYDTWYDMPNWISLLSNNRKKNGDKKDNDVDGGVYSSPYTFSTSILSINMEECQMMIALHQYCLSSSSKNKNKKNGNNNLLNQELAETER